MVSTPAANPINIPNHMVTCNVFILKKLQFTPKLSISWDHRVFTPHILLNYRRPTDSEPSDQFCVALGSSAVRAFATNAQTPKYINFCLSWQTLWTWLSIRWSKLLCENKESRWQLINFKDFELSVTQLSQQILLLHIPNSILHLLA